MGHCWIWGVLQFNSYFFDFSWRWASFSSCLLSFANGDFTASNPRPGSHRVVGGRHSGLQLSSIVGDLQRKRVNSSAAPTSSKTTHSPSRVSPIIQALLISLTSQLSTLTLFCKVTTFLKPADIYLFKIRPVLENLGQTNHHDITFHISFCPTASTVTILSI